jgi:cytidylate kinase
MSQSLLIDQILEDLNARDARDARLRALWQMTPAQRVAAMRRSELTLEQCAAWAARHPTQVPLLNGEFEYLAMFTPEVCE